MQITGVFSAQFNTLQSNNGRTLTKDKEIIERWKEYTEQLYRKDESITDSYEPPE